MLTPLSLNRVAALRILSLFSSIPGTTAWMLASPTVVSSGSEL